MNGLIKQWGIATTGSGQYIHIDFPIVFSDTNYEASAIPLRFENEKAGSYPIVIGNIHADYFTIFFNSNIRISWSAMGY